MNPNPELPSLDQTPVVIDEAAEILGVRPSVLEDLTRWGELPSTTIDGQLAISRSTLDGLFDAGIGTERDLGLEL
jgi:hypothetical protein